MINFDSIKNPLGILTQLSDFTLYLKPMPPSTCELTHLKIEKLPGDKLTLLQICIPGFSGRASDTAINTKNQLLFFSKNTQGETILYGFEEKDLRRSSERNKLISIFVESKSDASRRLLSNLHNNLLLWVEKKSSKDQIVIFDQDTKNHSRLLRSNGDIQSCTPSPDGECLITIEPLENDLFWNRNKLLLFAIKRKNGNSFKSKEIEISLNGEAFFNPIWINSYQFIYVSQDKNWHSIYCYCIKNEVSELIFEQEFLSLPHISNPNSLIFQKDQKQLIFITRKNACDEIKTIDLRKFICKRNENRDGFQKKIPVAKAVSSFLTSINQAVFPKLNGSMICAGSSVDYVPGIYQVNISERNPSVWPIKTYDEFKDFFSDTQLHYLHLSQNKECPALFYQPNKHAKNKSKQKLIIVLHGGPYADVSAKWPVKAKILGQHGFATCYLNYPGSSNYGRRHSTSIFGKWFRYERDMIIDKIRDLKKLPHIDPEQIILWGGDIAATLIMHILHKQPKLVRGAICVYPIIDLNEYYENQNRSRKIFIERLIFGNQQKGDSKEWLKSKSLLQIPNTTKSKIILFYGDKDTVVKQSDYKKFIQKLKDDNVNVKATCFKGEGHSWRQNVTYERYYKMIIEFIKQS